MEKFNYCIKETLIQPWAAGCKLTCSVNDWPLNTQTERVDVNLLNCDFVKIHILWSKHFIQRKWENTLELNIKTLKCNSTISWNFNLIYSVTESNCTSYKVVLMLCYWKYQHNISSIRLISFSSIRLIGFSSIRLISFSAIRLISFLS